MTDEPELDFAFGVGGAGEWKEGALKNTVVAGVMAVVEDGTDGAEGYGTRACALGLDG